MTTLRIDSDFIIIGDGESFTNGSIIIQDNKITFVGEQEHAPEADTTITCPVVMPGLWDCHVHYLGIKTPSLETTVTTNQNIALLRGVRDVHETLMAGITSVREVGGLGIYLNQAIREKVIQGPRIYAAGNVLSTTGGHGDIHNIPLDFVQTLSNASGVGTLADGIPECLREVRKQLRKGAEIIKYCASGGVMSEIDHPIHQQFSMEEQKAIVNESKRAEISVAAHCHGAPGIKSALEAGVTTIEHGTYLDEDLADLMIEKNAILVPTRYVIEKLMIGAEKMGVPEYAMVKLRALYDQHLDAMKIAIKKGVTFAMGTDIFTSGPSSIFTWGENAMELEFLVKAGMSPDDAIIAGTSHGPLTLGKRAPKSGQLKTGYDADLLLLKTNPLENISSLYNLENIQVVIRQGNVV